MKIHSGCQRYDVLCATLGRLLSSPLCLQLVLDLHASSMSTRRNRNETWPVLPPTFITSNRRKQTPETKSVHHRAWKMKCFQLKEWIHLGNIVECKLSSEMDSSRDDLLVEWDEHHLLDFRCRHLVSCADRR